jgi:hypothetical protein
MEYSMRFKLNKESHLNSNKPIPLNEVDIEDLTLFIPSDHICNRTADAVELFYDKEGFIVQKGDKAKRVNSYDTDALFRNTTLENVGKFSALNKFVVKELDNGDYIISPQMGLNGGGPGGASAGFFTGKFLVHLVAQTGIVIISAGAALVGGPAAGIAVGVALEKTVAPAVEVASNVVGLAGGILGGVATGPV